MSELTRSRIRPPTPEGTRMATPLTQTHTTRLSLTVHVTTEVDRMPELTAGLVRALHALGDGDDRLAVTVTEEATRPGVVVPLPRKGAPLRLDPQARRVLWRGREVALTRLEFDLLLFLATNANRVFRRRALMTEVWKTTYVSERTVDVHVRRLRGKIDPNAQLIRTVRGVGYQFGDPGLVAIE
ncbi:winged helix-turn-helix domain-containing protein [Actinokineospora sp. NBRC 105648]|uniref:winged helix-turn-helix domain-containing protein n=1 Tax=Actinokineospora sp. NBRC 105648 TaxID=3032206 RepID=UPI0024A3E554|nr:winged helix-turn-helix domain-containing protein [Actinokineospora sp. NBRC 105648]GLZ42925.1 hypothetical protein Acsp05_65490 [Actinokineospora sp. NBRC 105648]